jgi:hypothetical protein
MCKDSEDKIKLDGYSLRDTENLYGMSEYYPEEGGLDLDFSRYNTERHYDVIEFNNDIDWKYNEGNILKELESYLISTYSQHYVDKNSSSDQTLDKIKHSRREGFFGGNVVKYIDRYDSKGTPRQDLFKVLHYTILLINHLELIEN